VKAIVAIIIGVMGLLISSCGLMVIGLSFRGSGNNAVGIWTIAVPFVIAGGLLLWGAVALWSSWRKSTKAGTAGPPPGNTPPST
jgi:hypothetical protein